MAAAALSTGWQQEWEAAARHGPSAIPHAPAPRYRGRYTHPRCPLPSSASPPRPRHGKSRFIFIRAFVLSQCLHLVSIVCDVSVGRRGGLSGACYSARNHSADGLRPAAALPSLCILPFSRCTWLVLGRSSSRAIPGLFRVAAATCDGFLPRNRAETDEGCRHVGRRRQHPAAFATTLFFLPIIPILVATR